MKSDFKTKDDSYFYFFSSTAYNLLQNDSYLSSSYFLNQHAAYFETGSILQVEKKFHFSILYSVFQAYYFQNYKLSKWLLDKSMEVK